MKGLTTPTVPASFISNKTDLVLFSGLPSFVIVEVTFNTCVPLVKPESESENVVSSHDAKFPFHVWFTAVPPSIVYDIEMLVIGFNP